MKLTAPARDRHCQIKKKTELDSYREQSGPKASSFIAGIHLIPSWERNEKVPKLRTYGSANRGTGSIKLSPLTPPSLPPAPTGQPHRRPQPRWYPTERGGPRGCALDMGPAAGLHLRRRRCRWERGGSLTLGPAARWPPPWGRCASSSASRNGRAPAPRQARGGIVPRGGRRRCGGGAAELGGHRRLLSRAAAPGPSGGASVGGRRYPGSALPLPARQVTRLGHGDARYKAAAGRGRPARSGARAHGSAAAAGRSQWRGAGAPRSALLPGARRAVQVGPGRRGAGAGGGT